MVISTMKRYSQLLKMNQFPIESVPNQCLTKAQRKKPMNLGLYDIGLYGGNLCIDAALFNNVNQTPEEAQEVPPERPEEVPPEEEPPGFIPGQPSEEPSQPPWESPPSEPPMEIPQDTPPEV
jgi:hypothetical protein